MRRHYKASRAAPATKLSGDGLERASAQTSARGTSALRPATRPLAALVILVAPTLSFWSHVSLVAVILVANP